MVPVPGLEPGRREATDFESVVYTNFTTLAHWGSKYTELSKTVNGFVGAFVTLAAYVSLALRYSRPSMADRPRAISAIPMMWGVFRLSLRNNQPNKIAETGTNSVTSKMFVAPALANSLKYKI